jgi:hypothetical protein
MAMGPRIYTHLELSADGLTVNVKGPAGPWEQYVESATFAVIIGQARKADGELVLAKGRSTRTYTKVDDEWWADAVVFDPTDAGTVLQRGPAEAWGVASVKLTNGKYDTFGWGMSVRLIDQPAP